MSSTHPIDFALLTDVGRSRVHNEDACAADESMGLFVVCDGMGGAAGGEIASQMAARTFLAHARVGNADFVIDRLNRAVQAANSAVFGEAARDPRLRGMGTTLVGIEVNQDAGRIAIVHVGDSRCYRLRGDELHLMTEDHSLVEEQLRRGEITAEEAANSPMRNVITRAVGSHEEVEAEVNTYSLEPGDLYLLCSDGLTLEVDEQTIANMMATAEDDLPMCARALIHEANDNGGGDNVTVVLVRG